MPGTKIRREISVGNPTCLLGFSGRDSVDSATFDASTLDPGGVSEVQTLTVTGTPTGGTFKLSFKGQTTGTIAYNASTATVQTALRALSRIGSAGVTVTGSGALPGNVHTITFGGKLANQDVDLITVSTNSLTGGTSPAVTLAELTKGDSTFAGLYVLRSGLVLMMNATDDKVIEWDGGSPTDIVGIFDGQRELLGPEDHPVIPVYNHQCVFDKDEVQGYATNSADLLTWAAAHACQFKSQGAEA